MHIKIDKFTITDSRMGCWRSDSWQCDGEVIGWINLSWRGIKRAWDIHQVPKGRSSMIKKKKYIVYFVQHSFE